MDRKTELRQYINQLQSQGSDAFYQLDENGDSIFHILAAEGFSDLFSICLEHAPEGIHLRNTLGHYPLHTAVLNRQLDMVIYLSNKPHIVNQKDSKGRLLIHYAVLYGNLEMVTYACIVNKSDINQEDIDGHTPLVLSIRTTRPKPDVQHLEKLKQLKAHNADINVMDHQGMSTLHHAINSMDLDTIRWVTEHIDAAHINHADHQGHTPLYHLRHYHTQHPHFEAIQQYLLEKGATETNTHRLR